VVAGPRNAGAAGRELRIGVGLYTGQRAEGGRRFADAGVLASAAEGAGFDSFWVCEHHGLPDGYLPAPLTLLAAVAATTSTIELGTGVLLAPLHHPLRIAEDAAVVDHVSDGRLVLGLGLGYAEQEYRAFGVDPTRRGRDLDALVPMLRDAWTGERFSCGALGLDSVRVTPPPRHSIPIWLGGYAPPAVRRAGRLADGHLVGRGDAHIVDAASEVLRTLRPPQDSGFVRALNVAVVLDEPGGGAAGARAAFAEQQRMYERIQSGREVYAGLVDGTKPAGEALVSGSIDAYLQVRGDADEVVEGLTAVLNRLADWSRVHLVLRLLFPEPSVEVQLRRLAAFGERILPRVRARFAERTLPDDPGR
jgi:alkanesulfonate monooxygenase SsuD/methylene tetrahydromethanopterin reductase-like flavin-dependent oxidoreductase (luciferase family)